MFFSGDLHLNDQWTVTAGLRWTEETKDFIGGNGGAFYDPALGEPIPGLVDPQPFNGKWSEVTPKIGFQYQHDEDIMVFGSYSEGFKSGASSVDKLTLTSTRRMNLNMLRALKLV